MNRCLVLISLLASFATVQSAGAQYLKCFRDEGGVLHEVFEKMPEATPPPTIQVVPPTTTTTVPPVTLHHQVQTYWRLHCPNGLMWGLWTNVYECTDWSAWIRENCPKKYVRGPSKEWIRAFRSSCPPDNGMSCRCLPEYH